MRLNKIFRWASGRPAYPGTGTCGWGRGQCYAMIRYSMGLYDYPASNNNYCLCECKLYFFHLKKKFKS